MPTTTKRPRVNLVLASRLEALLATYDIGDELHVDALRQTLRTCEKRLRPLMRRYVKRRVLEVLDDSTYLVVKPLYVV